MGIFTKKEDTSCCICGNQKTKSIKDGYVCKNCLQEANIFLSKSGLSTKDLTVSQIKEFIIKSKQYIELMKERNSVFNCDKKFGNVLFIDEKNNLFKLNKKSENVYSFDQVFDFELIEDGETLSKGGVGRAIVGGALLGGVGAVVGGITGKKNKKVCSKMYIRIGINNDVENNLNIYLINTNTKTNGIIYNSLKKLANDIITYLSQIESSNNDIELNDNERIDKYEEIKKLKELLDMGIITTDEFDNKKRELLNL